MIEKDTVRLLRECDAGVKMGVKSISDVLKHTQSSELHRILSDSKSEHEAIDKEIQGELKRYDDDGKNPSPVATGMSKMKTAMKIAVNDSDKTVADLITDGCNMGVKSLSKYLNEYKAADERSKDIAKRLINVEHTLAVDMRGDL